jgi:HAD superfamily hydrolase (TIGR01509 family)
MTPSSIRALFFDFDGVLADSEDLHFELFQKVLEEEGFTLEEEEYYKKYLGFDDRDCFLNFLADQIAPAKIRKDSEIKRLIEKKAKLFQEAIPKNGYLFEEVPDVIKSLKQSYPLVIVSGALKPEIKGILAQGDCLPYFELIVSAEDTPEGKPQPVPYQFALKQLNKKLAKNISPKNSLVIEDSPLGLQAGKAAGMKTLAITGTYGAGELQEANWILDSLENLTLEWLKKI